MRTFLSVTQGSAQPPKLLELHYHGAPNSKEPPVVFIGKGITFDSGGISLKPSAGMKLMRGDMGGAATACAAALAIAKLKIPCVSSYRVHCCGNMLNLTPGSTSL